MQDKNETWEERSKRLKKEARAEKARIKKWIKVHSKWNDFSRNQKRNMRKRLSKK